MDKSKRKLILFFSFEGYDLGDEMLAASGVTYHMFPSDGALIRTNVTELVEGSKAVHASLIKDKHILVSHIINPKDVVTQLADEEVKEKSETEKPEKETLETELIEKQSSHADDEFRKTVKPVVGEYASFSATLADGICLAFSTYGKTGKVEGGEIYKPDPYVTPHVRTPTPTVPVGGKESAASKKKGKAAKEKKEEPEPSPIRATGTPTSSSNVFDGERKSVKTESYEDSSFLKLQFSTPSGLVVTFLKKDDALTVQQQYPFKTKEVDPCKEISSIAGKEEKRIYTSDGSLLILSNNSTVSKILYPNGKMTEYSSTTVPNEKATGSRNTSPQRGTSPKDAPKRLGRRKHSPKVEDEVAETITREKWYTVQTMGERLITLKEGDNVENIPVEPLLKCECFDPSSNQVMITRDDKTIIIRHADGTLISEHPDGTRFTTYSHDDKNMGDTSKLIKVENPAYCTVTFDSSSGECHVETASKTIINAFPSGNYELHHADGSFMRIEQNGSVSFTPKPNDFQSTNPQHPPIYHMRHDAEVILYSVDNNGNRFSVKNTGQSNATLVEKSATVPRSSEENTIITTENKTPSLTGGDEIEEGSTRKIDIEYYDEHAPRFFVINPDGRSGMELLRYQDVADWITTAEIDPFTAVILDQVSDRPNIASISTLIPHIKRVSQRWVKSYDDDSIIPPGLTLRDLTSFPSLEEKKAGPNFGTNAGRGLEIGSKDTSIPPPLPKCPETLQIRQVLQYKPLTPEIREDFSNGLESYANHVVSRFKEGQNVEVEEYRSESEQKIANALLEDSGTVHLIENRMSVTSLIEEKEDQRDSLLLEPTNIRSVYERQTAPKVPSPIPPPLPKRTKEDWDRDKQELEEETANRRILRNKYVPPYFKSHFGKLFLTTIENKDEIDVEKTENFEPEKVIAQEDEKPSQTTYEEETPSPNQGVTGNTPSSIRPTNPTPGVAGGRTSPTVVRPAAPTPVHGVTKVQPERPEAPTPNQEREDTKATLITTSSSQSYRAVSNEKFTKVEDPVRRKVFTAPIAGATPSGVENLLQLRGFILQPEAADFGFLKEGNTYNLNISLRNTGHDTCRFKVKQPLPSTGLRILYKPGPVAAGMKSEINIQIFALLSDAVDGVASVKHELEIITETHVLYLPITAVVLSQEAYLERVPPSVKKNPNVRLISSESPVLTKPRRVYEQSKPNLPASLPIKAPTPPPKAKNKEAVVAN